MSIYKNVELQISDEGADFIGDWEGEELWAYRDVKGIWTIGIGHIETAHEGMVITREEMFELFRQDVERYIDAINRVVTARLTQRQYDALVSLCFNIGVAGFSNSTVCRMLNQERYLQAADAFLMWNKVRDQGRLRVVQGLANRRKAERSMFLEGTPTGWLHG